MNLFMSNKKKQELLDLQNIVLKDSPDRLIFSEKELIQLAYRKAENSLRIVQECSQILQTTIKPDVFFNRFQLLILHSSEMAILEKFISFSGASPVYAFNVFMNEKQNVIKQFLIRYFSTIDCKALDMKTNKGKMNQYQKFYDSLKPYYSEMDDENIDYIETKYKAYKRRLIKA